MQSYQIRLCTKNQDHCHVSEGEMIRKPKSGLSEARKFGSTQASFQEVQLCLSSTLPKHSIVLTF